ncbi:MAG: hypothetical protein V9F00_17905 [Nocardioides sp.]
MPLSVSVDAGIPCWLRWFGEGGGTIGAVIRPVGADVEGVAGAVVEPGDDLDVGAGSAVGRVGGSG